jgi:hypothetical protein
MSLREDLEKRKEELPACFVGGLRHNRAFIEFRPDPRKRVGFPWAQLCHYTFEPNQPDDAEAAERLTLAFSTADVVLVGARLGKLVDLVNEHDLDWVAALDARYSPLAGKAPWIASITIARIDKQDGASA